MTTNIYTIAAALPIACEYLASTIGTCPYDQLGIQVRDCENECTSNIDRCWWLYFVGKAKEEDTDENDQS